LVAPSLISWIGIAFVSIDGHHVATGPEAETRRAATQPALGLPTKAARGAPVEIVARATPVFRNSQHRIASPPAVQTWRWGPSMASPKAPGWLNHSPTGRIVAASQSRDLPDGSNAANTRWSA
jgi:hypothetical protein